MYEDTSKFLDLSTTELVLNAQDIQAIKKKSKDPVQTEINCYLNIQNLPEEVSTRYKHFQYLVDPSHKRFQSVVWIISLLFWSWSETVGSHLLVQNSRNLQNSPKKIFTKPSDTYSRKELKKSRSLSDHRSTRKSQMKLMEFYTKLVEFYQPTNPWKRYKSHEESEVVIFLRSDHLESFTSCIPNCPRHLMEPQKNIQELKLRGDMCSRLFSSWKEDPW